MSIRSMSTGGLPAARLNSRSTGSISDHRASLMSKRKAMSILRRPSTENNCPGFHEFVNTAGSLFNKDAPPIPIHSSINRISGSMQVPNCEGELQRHGGE